MEVPAWARELSRASGGDTPVLKRWMPRASARRVSTEPKTAPLQAGSRERAKECLPPCLAQC